MKLIFENAISLITELINIRNNQITIYNNLGNTKDSTALIFKVKNYKKWIEIITEHITLNTIINNENDIKTLKLTSKLELKLIEILKTNNIKDIEDAKKELLELEKLTKISVLSALSVVSSSNPNPTSNTPSTTPSTTPSNNVDTSKIEAQPKQLADKQRPKDKRGGDIYDLMYVHEIGSVKATKLVDDGVTLSGLLEEWGRWVSINPTNGILIASKLPRPNEYTEKQWKQLDDIQKDAIQKGIISKKINNETKLLQKIHMASIVGIKHFHNMSHKIPRSEIDRANILLQKIAKHMNKDIKIVLCGSYRRGRDKSGDIDCLILHPLVKTQSDLDNNKPNLLMQFVKLLIDTNFIVDQLSLGDKKFMGFCVVPNNTTGNTGNTAIPEPIISRRIDIRFVPYNSFGSALIYFTGSKTFNTTMRTHALNKGYSLSEFGFKHKTDNSLITFATEEEVFKFLDYPYKTPQERDI